MIHGHQTTPTDSLVTDGLAATREVILFNDAGISNSSGEVPATFEEMGANAIAFIKARRLKQVPGALRPPRLGLPVRVRLFSAFRFRIHAAIRSFGHEQSFGENRPGHRRLARHRPC
jgi:hypothetical protein